MVVGPEEQAAALVAHAVPVTAAEAAASGARETSQAGPGGLDGLTMPKLGCLAKRLFGR